MSAKRFLVDALGSALGVGLATPDDVLRHITADVLAEHLPRPLWSRLLAASLGAARLDSALVVETIGVANICEHIPSEIVFGCITEIAHRALGKNLVAPPPAPMLARGARATIPPPPISASTSSDVLTSAVVAGPLGPDAPGEDDISNLAASLGDAIDEALLPDEPRGDGRSRSPTRPPARAGLSTRPGASSRKPQTAAPVPVATPAGRVPQALVPPVRRGQTELETFEDSDFGSEGETRVGLSTSTVESEVAVDEEQLVDWQPS
jgi:hypothetical protein